MVILNLAVNSAIIIYNKLSLNTPERYINCDAIVDTGKLRRNAGLALLHKVNRSMSIRSSLKNGHLNSFVDNTAESNNRVTFSPTARFAQKSGWTGISLDSNNALPYNH